MKSLLGGQDFYITSTVSVPCSFLLISVSWWVVDLHKTTRWPVFKVILNDQWCIDLLFSALGLEWSFWKYLGDIVAGIWILKNVFWLISISCRKEIDTLNSVWGGMLPISIFITSRDYSSSSPIATCFPCFFAYSNSFLACSFSLTIPSMTTLSNWAMNL